MLSSWRATVTHGEQPDLHDISIHALLAESDAKQKIRYSSDETFLSTLSLRRATGKGTTTCHMCDDFFPRSPCGERLHNIGHPVSGCLFLSTLSLRRATGGFLARAPGRSEFLSTLSLRRATLGLQLPPPSQEDFYPRSPCGERRRSRKPLCAIALFLSTLSLRRATVILSWRRCIGSDFYPRSPCGERRWAVTGWLTRLKFLSTLSLRRATEFHNT